MKIKTKKGDICPICRKKILSPNCWVIYHINYEPQKTILACKYCNYTEYCLRNSLQGGRALSKIRVQRVINFQNKFNVTI